MAMVKKSKCLFCSLGCEVAFEAYLDEALSLEYGERTSGTGTLCSKGNYLLELINHPMRLTDPKIAGKPVEYGIGTHANSVIQFNLPPGYTRFKAKGGLDNGGTNQAGGSATSVSSNDGAAAGGTLSS